MICTVKIFEEGTFIFVRSTRKMEKGGKYLEQENIFFTEEKQNEEKKEANI